MDDLGSCLADTLTRVSFIAFRYACKRIPGEGGCHTPFGKMSTIAGAAFANACAGNGLDIDDGSAYTRGHPGVQLFPVALAVCERNDTMNGVISVELAGRGFTGIPGILGMERFEEWVKALGET